jgi:protein-S-isoprenylcysteine O-methyltransferase Ste14
MTDVRPVPVPDWVIHVARLRVKVGFGVAVGAFWLAQPSWLSLTLGAGIGMVGECLRVWAAGHLEKGSEVTTSGPYGWLRHPLYAGSTLLGIAFAVASRHLLASVLVVLYLSVSLSVAARLEEATLRVKFGPTYDRYARGVTVAGLRRFSMVRAYRNGEIRSVVGLAAGLLVLALKVVFSDCC